MVLNAEYQNAQNVRYVSVKEVRTRSHHVTTVELGNKELFGHPKIVP